MYINIEQRMAELAATCAKIGISFSEATEAMVMATRQLQGNAEIGEAMKEISNRLAGAETTKQKESLENFEPKIEDLTFLTKDITDYLEQTRSELFDSNN